MSRGSIGVQLLSVYVCLCQVLAEHPCGENPLRRYASLIRILNDLYPGRDINAAMALLRDSNPELHRRLQPIVSRLDAEWQLYTECVTMVDNGYFKRSELSSPSEIGNALAMKPSNQRHRILNGHAQLSREADSESRLADILKHAMKLNELPYDDSTS